MFVLAFFTFHPFPVTNAVRSRDDGEKISEKRRRRNPAAENLYGYKACEVVGHTVFELHLKDEHHPSTRDIIEKLSHGVWWSGQLPLRKRSGQIFMAMVTQSPLYENYELDAIVTASKVLSRKCADARFSTCVNAVESEDGDMEIHDMKADKPPRLHAAKHFSRSHTMSGLVDENIQQNGSNNNLRKDQAAYEACYCRDLAKSEYQASFEVHRSTDQLMRSSFQLDGKEFQRNIPNGRSLDSEAISHMQSQRIPNSRENVGSVLSRNGSDSHMVVNSKIRWEDLQLREEIGQGSFAVVYRGIWNGSDVAVKVYFSNQCREKTLLDYKKEGKSLQDTSQEQLNTRIRRCLKMAIDVARGMNYLHHINPPIVHRDLKSSNLLVNKSWTVKVGDFGLSKLKNASFLIAKSGLGTPEWMAPEVLRNKPSTEKSDVFSYGIILWELMTETIPWNNLNSLQVVVVVGFMDRRLDLPESIDPQVSAIISYCWHRMVDLVHGGRWSHIQDSFFCCTLEKTSPITIALMTNSNLSIKRIEM